MLKAVGMTVMMAWQNKEQHEDKGKERARNNHNMHIPSLHLSIMCYACYDCCMPFPCLFLHAAPYFPCHHHCFLPAYTDSCSCTFCIVIPISFNNFFTLVVHTLTSITMASPMHTKGDTHPTMTA